MLFRSKSALKDKSFTEENWGKTRAELVDEFLNQGLIGFRDTPKTRNMSLISNLTKHMGLDENPSNVRRKDGTLKGNSRPFSPATRAIHEFRRKVIRQNKETGLNSDVGVLSELDMHTSQRFDEQRIVAVEDIWEEELVKMNYERWEADKGNPTYNTWLGPQGDKTAMLYIKMPRQGTLEDAIAHYEQVSSSLTEGERAHDAFPTVADLIERHNNEGQGDDAQLTFRITDTANRAKLNHEIHGDFSKYGDTKAFVKRSSQSGSIGFTMDRDLFGADNFRTVTISDPTFLDTIHDNLRRTPKRVKRNTKTIQPTSRKLKPIWRRSNYSSTGASTRRAKSTALSRAPMVSP